MIEGYETAFAPEARGETTDSSDDMPKTGEIGDAPGSGTIMEASCRTKGSGRALRP